MTIEQFDPSTLFNVGREKMRQSGHLIQTKKPKTIETMLQTPQEQLIQTMVTALLAQYETYNSVSNLLQIAIATEETKERIQNLQSILESISNDMKFLYPLVWFRYKYEAYQGTPRAITTLQDLLTHALVDDSICGKRLQFIDQKLREKYDVSIQDQSLFSRDYTIPELVKHTILKKLFEDNFVLSEWLLEETHTNTETGSVSKWHSKG